MRVHEREMSVSIAKTHLEIALHNYQYPSADPESGDGAIDTVEMLRLVTHDIRDILLDMEPKVKRAKRFSHLEGIIDAFRHEQDDPRHEGEKLIALTEIEILQALLSYCLGKTKYMLRYERHGDYDHPSGLE